MDVSSFEPAWRKQGLQERLAHVFVHKLFMEDIRAEFQGTRYTFKGHKNILAHCSPVFRDHLYGLKKGEVLKDVDPKGLSYMLSVLYHVPSDVLDAHHDSTTILLAYNLARNLRARQIEDQLKGDILHRVRLSSELAAHHFWKFLELCLALRLDDITEELLKYARLYTKRILLDDSFLVVSPGTVIKVLGFDNLEIQEMDVLERVVCWYESNRSMPFSRDFLKDMLACVRFQNIKEKEFYEFLRKCWGVFDGKDAVQILCFLGNRESHTLPQWCSSGIRLPPISEFSSVFQEKINEKRSKPVPKSVNLLGMLNQDVRFLVGPAKLPVEAHRNILAIGSVVFERMFYGPLATGQREIEIDTCYPVGCRTSSGYADGFKTMIRYFYKDADFNQCLEHEVSTFAAALKYGSGRLKRLCAVRSDVGIDKNPLTPKVGTFWKHLEYFLILGDEEKNKRLTDTYLPFASENAKELLRHQTFLMASKEAVVAVLQLQELFVSEVDVLRSVLKWIHHQERREFFKYELLKNVRFGDMSLEAFLSVVSQNRTFVASDDIVSICVHLFDRTSPLPGWCGGEPPRKREKDGSKSVPKSVRLIDGRGAVALLSMKSTRK